MPRTDHNDSSLLLEISVPFRRDSDGWLVEAQALNGMRLWAEHFSHVTVCAPIIPDNYSYGSSFVWADSSALLAEGRVSFEPLPWGFHPRDHFRHRAMVRRRMETLVEQHRYLCFSNLGAFGGWGGFAVDAARRQHRAYSLWFDSVLHKMSSVEGSSPKKLIRDWVYRRMTKHETYRAIGACSLGLFHGQTVFDAYAPLCKTPALVHNVHVHPRDAITDDLLNARLASTHSRSPLRIGYVGRVHAMKAPVQWIDAIAQAVRTLGKSEIDAVWLGDGPLLGDARTQVMTLGLHDVIRFPGFVSDRSAVLEFLRGLDLFLFTHVTPESPRCLIEALVSGVPLVGYESSYVTELVGDRGGAKLSPIGDSRALAANMINLAQWRTELVSLTHAAATAREIFNDESVFAHRSELIKRLL